MRSNRPRHDRCAVHSLFARSVLSHAVVLACLALGTAALPVQAQGARGQVAATRVDIPPGTLDQVLNRFAAAAGVMIAIDGSLTAGKKSAGLNGSYGAREGLAAILAGSGLEAVSQSSGGYMLRAARPAPVPAAAPAASPSRASTAQVLPAETTLPAVKVTAAGNASSYQPTAPVSGATRSPVAARDLPQAVDVVPENALRDQGATSLKDALLYTPGVTTSTGEGIREQFVIRGFSAIADTYVDGMRDGGNTFRDTFNLEQIEVVKGPAGVLYGRGSAGGLINLVTKRPLPGSHAEAAVTVGSKDARRLTVDVNRPLTENLLFRVNAMVDEADSFRSDVWSRKRGVALASTLKLASRATLDLRAQHVYDKRVFDAGLPGLFGRPADVPISNYYGARSPGSNDSGTSEENAISADLNVELSDTLRLRNTFTYRALDLDRRQTTIDRLILTTATPTLRLARSSFSSQQKDFADKLELTSRNRWLGVDHELMVGTEFASEKRDTISRGGTLAASYDISVFDPVLVDVPWQGSSVRRDGIYDTKTTSLYVQDLLRFNPQWVALAGVRQDWLNRDFKNRAGADYGRKDDFLSSRIGLVYQPSSTASYYISATRSYQPGGATGVVDPGNAIQPPEISTNYEIGGKLSLNEGRLQIGLSLFQLIKENVPTRDPSDPSGPSLYIGEITAKGVELSSVGDLGGGLSLQGGITWLDAVVTRSNNTTAAAITPTPAATPLEGKRAANAPKFSAALWGVQRLSPSWRVGVGVRHQSKSFASTTNAVALPAYTVMDVGVFHESGPWSLTLSLRNVTGKKYYVSSTNDLGILPGAPRTVLLTARYVY